MNNNLRSGLVLVLLGIVGLIIGGDIGRGVGGIFIVVGLLFAVVGLIQWRPNTSDRSGRSDVGR